MAVESISSGQNSSILLQAVARAKSLKLRTTDDFDKITEVSRSWGPADNEIVTMILACENSKNYIVRECLEEYARAGESAVKNPTDKDSLPRATFSFSKLRFAQLGLLVLGVRGITKQWIDKMEDNINSKEPRLALSLVNLFTYLRLQVDHSKGGMFFASIPPLPDELSAVGEYLSRGKVIAFQGKDKKLAEMIGKQQSFYKRVGLLKGDQLLEVDRLDAFCGKI